MARDEAQELRVAWQGGPRANPSGTGHRGSIAGQTGRDAEALQVPGELNGLATGPLARSSPEDGADQEATVLARPAVEENSEPPRRTGAGREGNGEKIETFKQTPKNNDEAIAHRNDFREELQALMQQLNEEPQDFYEDQMDEEPHADDGTQ